MPTPCLDHRNIRHESQLVLRRRTSYREVRRRTQWLDRGRLRTERCASRGPALGCVSAVPQRLRLSNTQDPRRGHRCSTGDGVCEQQEEVELFIQPAAVSPGDCGSTAKRPLSELPPGWLAKRTSTRSRMKKQRTLRHSQAPLHPRQCSRRERRRRPCHRLQSCWRPCRERHIRLCLRPQWHRHPRPYHSQRPCAGARNVRIDRHAGRRRRGRAGGRVAFMRTRRVGYRQPTESRTTSHRHGAARNLQGAHRRHARACRPGYRRGHAERDRTRSRCRSRGARSRAPTSMRTSASAATGVGDQRWPGGGACCLTPARGVPLRDAHAVTGYVNPVCGAIVDPARALSSITMAGQTHYFCCQGCRTEFERDPQKYLEIGAHMREPARTTHE